MSEADPASIPQLFAEMKAGVRMDYDAGNEGRFQRKRRLPGQGAHADYHIRDEGKWIRIIERVRDMLRNDAVARALVQRSIANVFQAGFTFDPQTGDDGLNLDLWNAWEAWSTDPAACDASGRFPFNRLVELAAHGNKADGDAFLLPLTSGRLELMEAHRCRTPNGKRDGVVHGVEIDNHRAPQAYWFTQEDTNPYETCVKTNKLVRIPARDKQTGGELVWHILDAERISQTRGISPLATVSEKLGFLDDILFAELVKRQTGACLVFLRERALAFGGGQLGTTGDTRTETRSDGTTETVQQIKPGTEIRGLPGETLKAFAPNIALGEDQQSQFVLNLICAALNVPPIVLLLDATETNFTGWRGVLDQAKIGWTNEQIRYREQIHRRAWRWRIAWQAQRDPVLRRHAERLGDKLWACRIRMPKWAYIQPEVQAGADETILRVGLDSPRGVLSARDLDHEQVVDEGVADRAYTIQTALARAAVLTKATGQEIDPRQLIHLDLSRPLTVAAPDAAPAQPVNIDQTLAVTRALRGGDLEAPAARELLTALGLAPDAADRIIAAVPPLTVTAEILNGAQITAALEVMRALRGGQLAPAAAIELLVGVGVERNRASGMVNATPVDSSTDAATLDFKRKAWLTFQADGTVSDIAANLTVLRTLAADVGLPVNPEYQPPRLPVRDDTGELVDEQAIEDSDADELGEEATATAPDDRTAEPLEPTLAADPPEDAAPAEPAEPDEPSPPPSAEDQQ